MTSKERSLMWESIRATNPYFLGQEHFHCVQALIHKGQRLNIVFLLTIAFSLICLILVLHTIKVTLEVYSGLQWEDYAASYIEC